MLFTTITVIKKLYNRAYTVTEGEVLSKEYVITGGDGQLGRALREKYPQATALTRDQLDITDTEQLQGYDWSAYSTIINAAAYVNADGAEHSSGRMKAWSVNAQGPRNLAKVAIDNGLRLVHFSSEYVFDGTKQNHSEHEPLAPLSVYGQAKAAGDLAVSLVPNHYNIRTTWVVGDGHNFVKTMKRLAEMRIDPSVVDDQYGRLTFTSELSRAVDFLINNDAPSGLYNVTNTGPIKSWYEIAADTFELAGFDRNRVKPVTTDEYSDGKDYFAPRPKYSDLDLSKIQSLGFRSLDYTNALEEYISKLPPVE